VPRGAPRNVASPGPAGRNPGGRLVGQGRRPFANHSDIVTVSLSMSMARRLAPKILR
jgi:hypothetical protein